MLKCDFKKMGGGWLWFANFIKKVQKIDNLTIALICCFKAKWDKGSINVFCTGRIGHPDSNFVFDKQIFEHLKEEPQKCAWIDKEKSLAYIFHFETEKDAVEFYEKVLEMKEWAIKRKVTFDLFHLVLRYSTYTRDHWLYCFFNFRIFL